MAGKGSIEKRGENTWRLIVSAGMKEDKQIKKKKSITTTASCPESSCRGCSKISRCKARKEVEKALAEFVLEIEKGVYFEPTKLTFKDFTDRWLRDYAEGNLAPKTLFRYKQILDSRVYPAMGHLAVEKITPVHVMEFYSNLQEEGIRLDGKLGGLSDNTILYHHRIISSIMQDAVQWQVIPSNPASRVKPPKVKKKTAGFYDEEQTATLFTAIEKEHIQYQAIVILAITTGLRRGELMGLEWRDINFKDNTLTVRQASQYVPGKGTFAKEPKNETSKRTISVQPSTMALLKQYKAYQAQERLKVGDIWQGTERLFTTWDGKPMHPDTISKWFPKFLTRAKLPPLPFHGLRHTAATLLISTGMEAKTVSGRFGHANISTTYNIYGHYLKSTDKEAADRLEQVYQRLKGNVKETKKEQA